MNTNKNIKKNLKCLKTGSKATIIKSYFLNNIAYVKINIPIKFEDTHIQVTKTLVEDELENHFTCS